MTISVVDTFSILSSIFTILAFFIAIFALIFNDTFIRVFRLGFSRDEKINKVINDATTYLFSKSGEGHGAYGADVVGMWLCYKNNSPETIIALLENNKGALEFKRIRYTTIVTNATKLFPLQKQ